MNAVAAQALAAADWSELGPTLQRDAHNFIARYLWRGLKVKTSADGRLSIGDRGPEDFVLVAMAKLVDGTRTYREDLSLEDNLRRTIESDVNDYWKKTCRRLPLVDRTAAQAIASPSDPIDCLPDGYETDAPAEAAELRRRQREMLDALSAAVAGDEELSLVLMAYEEGKYKPAEIMESTGIAADRVSEVKRKLNERAEKFIRTHPEYADLKPLKEVS